MANLPLQDGYETQLAQSWNGAVGTIYVLETPVYTPKTTPTIITVNPGKTNAQLAVINDYDASAKTLTCSAVTGLYKAKGVLSTARSHGTGSKVIISDNYEFWRDLVAKSDNNTFTGDQTFSGVADITTKLKIPFFANAAARDAAITVPSDSMMCYVNDIEEFMGYKNGAWQTLGGGGGASAVWYQDSTGDGTITGAINGVNTSFVLSHTPGSVDAMILTYNGQVMERGATDDYTLVANTITMNFAPVSGRLVAIYPDQGVGTQNATTRSTTGASSVNGELFRKSDDSNSLYYKDNAGDQVKLVDITSNKIPLASIETIPSPTNVIYGTASFSSNKYNVTTSPTTPPVTGMVLRFLAPDTSGSYANGINLNGNGNVNFYYTIGGVPLNLPFTNQSYKTGDLVEVQYDGTYWHPINKFELGDDNGKWSVYTGIITYSYLHGLIVGGSVGKIGSTGAAGGSFAGTLMGSSNIQSYDFSIGGNAKFKLKWRQQVDNPSFANIGFGMSPDNTSPFGLYNAHTSTAEHAIRFFSDMATGFLWACNSNGSAATYTNIGSLSSGWTEYEIVIIPNSTIYFFVDKVLKATHTTNLPTSGTPYFGIAASTSASSIGVGTSQITWMVSE